MKKTFLIGIPLLITMAVLFLFQGIFFIGVVPTASMEPTLPQGCIIVGTRFIGELTSGDIIVFKHEGKTLVKRIAAVEGEYAEGNIKVPAGCFYVLGDNRDDSIDSRFWEDPFVKKSDIIAKINS